jgi:hypothetical protein
MFIMEHFIDFNFIYFRALFEGKFFLFNIFFCLNLFDKTINEY